MNDTTNINEMPVMLTPLGKIELRDWLAGQALAACKWEYCNETQPQFTDDQIAQECYKMADAMLKAREL